MSVRQPVACLRSVGKTYASGAAAVRALDGVDFEAYPGEVVLLKGPSGSGKTTLLSILGCILKPSAGGVAIQGRELAGVPESRLPQLRLRHVGFIFQAFNLLPALTARENVQLPLDLKKMTKSDARRTAADWLDRVGLSGKRDAVPADLSGGEKQRVAIARALATDPDLLLADEPTAALDSNAGRAVMELLADFGRRGGRAVVIVSHDPRIDEFAGRIVHMEDGRIRA
jgi:putative ABC transport system ATP-binding protein